MTTPEYGRMVIVKLPLASVVALASWLPRVPLSIANACTAAPLTGPFVAVPVNVPEVTAPGPPSPLPLPLPLPPPQPASRSAAASAIGKPWVTRARRAVCVFMFGFFIWSICGRHRTEDHIGRELRPGRSGDDYLVVPLAIARCSVASARYSCAAARYCVTSRLQCVAIDVVPLAADDL